MEAQGPRKKKRLLAPSEKYEIWLQLVRGEATVGEAADRAGVDRSTVAKLREVARRGALEALAASRPGRPTLGVTSSWPRRTLRRSVGARRWRRWR